MNQSNFAAAVDLTTKCDWSARVYLRSIARFQEQSWQPFREMVVARSDPPGALQKFPELMKPDEQQAFLSASDSGARFGAKLSCWQIKF